MYVTLTLFFVVFSQFGFLDLRSETFNFGSLNEFWQHDQGEMVY